MYKPGDHVFYPKGGVFVIEKESQKDIAGHSISFFDLISSDAKTRISIPKANVDRVGVRRLVTEQEFDREVDCWIPDIKISKLHHKNRKSRFETMRQTGTFNEMGSVIVTIHYLINKTKATFEEKRMYDQIRKRMVNEIEIIKTLNPTTAESLLQGALDVAILRRPLKEDLEDGEVDANGETVVAAAGEATSSETVTEKSEPEAAKTEETKAVETKAVETESAPVEVAPDEASAKPKQNPPAKSPEKAAEAAPKEAAPKEAAAVPVAKPAEKAAKPKAKTPVKAKEKASKPAPKPAAKAEKKPASKPRKATAAKTKAKTKPKKAPLVAS